jgi:hypothetical protein
MKLFFSASAIACVTKLQVGAGRYLNVANDINIFVGLSVNLCKGTYIFFVHSFITTLQGKIADKLPHMHITQNKCPHFSPAFDI